MPRKHADAMLRRHCSRW